MLCGFGITLHCFGITLCGFVIKLRYVDFELNNVMRFWNQITLCDFGIKLR